MTKNKNLNVRIEENDLEKFDRIYPNCKSRFVQMAIKKALKNRDFFESVFFDKKLIYGEN